MEEGNAAKQKVPFTAAQKYDEALEREIRRARVDRQKLKREGLPDNDEVVRTATEELKQDPCNVKSLMHRGQAYVRKGAYNTQRQKAVLYFSLYMH